MILWHTTRNDFVGIIMYDVAKKVENVRYRHCKFSLAIDSILDIYNQCSMGINLEIEFQKRMMDHMLSYEDGKLRWCLEDLEKSILNIAAYPDTSVGSFYLFPVFWRCSSGMMILYLR